MLVPRLPTRNFCAINQHRVAVRLLMGCKVAQENSVWKVADEMRRDIGSWSNQKRMA